MIPHLDPDVLNGWIGLRTHDDYEMAGLLDIGSTYVVYHGVKQGSEDTVLKLPRSHIGFIIDIPPPLIFRTPLSMRFGPLIEVVSSQAQQTLNARLVALAGSPLLSHVWPLDTVLQKVAVELLQPGSYRLRYTDKRQPKYSTLVPSSFIAERLHDWTSIAIGHDSHDLFSVYAYEDPILVDFPEFISRNARAAISQLKALDTQPHAKDPSVLTVENNPLLPFIAALSSGYELGESSVHSGAQLLSGRTKPGETLRQIGQVLYDLEPMLNLKDRMRIISFVVAVSKSAPNTGLEELSQCMQELRQD